MKKNLIGYRLKFDEINSEDIKIFIDEYQKNFDRYEIKVTKNLISSGKLELILDVSLNIANGKFSIHLPKDLLNNSKSFDLTVKTIEILKKFNISEKVYLVTHFPKENLLNYFSKIEVISKILPENCILLLENVVVEKENENYLNQINEICHFLEVENIKNVGICLDIGHLLFGCSKEKISERLALRKLQKMTYMMDKIKQLHIHDYFNTDHIHIGYGMMDFVLVFDFIRKNFSENPIIIETKVKQPLEDGIEQVIILESFL